MEEVIIKSITDIGFPIALCFYLITKTTSQIKKNTEAVKELTKKIELLTKKIAGNEN